MVSRAEDVLYGSLSDADALEQVAKMGLPTEAIPTESMRQVVEWAMDYFFTSGRLQAPSRMALVEVWGQVMEDEEIVLLPEDEETDTVDWAVANLKDTYAHYAWQRWLEKAATQIAAAAPETRVATMGVLAADLFGTVASMADRTFRTEARPGYLDSLHGYEHRAANDHVFGGMTFGLGAIDEFTYGIHDGELAVFAGGAKSGKSLFLDRVALHNWRDRGLVVVLNTMENSVAMTIDRIVCMHLGINPRAYQRGEVDADKIKQVKEFIEDEMASMPGELHVVMPQRGQRTVEAIVREAQILGAQALLVDQLTSLEHPDPGRRQRNEVVGDIMYDLQESISSTAERMPCLLAHQISREGVKAAAKTGHLEMYHLAESAGVERAVDWAFGLFQSDDDRIAGVAKFQTLAARREDIKHWQVSWRVSDSVIRVQREITLDH